MIVIIANINNLIQNLLINKSKLDSSLLVLGIKKIYHVTESIQLKSIAVENRNKEIILFSNFPPDKIYPDKNTSTPIYMEAMRLLADMDRSNYNSSTKLFTELGKMKCFKAVQFITGARIKNVADRNLEDLFPYARTSVKRKQDWEEEQNYFNKYEQCIIEVVRRMLLRTHKI